MKLQPGAGLLADCSTKIIYAQEADEAKKTGRVLGLSSTEISQLPDLDMGEGLWRIGSVPSWFVTFARPVNCRCSIPIGVW